MQVAKKLAGFALGNSFRIRVSLGVAPWGFSYVLFYPYKRKCAYVHSQG